MRFISFYNKDNGNFDFYIRRISWIFKQIERKSLLRSLVSHRLVTSLGFLAYLSGSWTRTIPNVHEAFVMHKWGCPSVKNAVIFSINLGYFLTYLGISYFYFIYFIIIWEVFVAVYFYASSNGIHYTQLFQTFYNLYTN